MIGGSNERSKKIDTANLRIENNIISVNDIMLQVSNISQVSIESIPKKEFNPIALILLLLGVLGVGQRNEEIKVYGVTSIIILIVYIVWIVVTNLNNNGRYLYIYMNSGNCYYIYCANEVFLKKVIEVLEYCINNHWIQEVYIDFDKCLLYNSPTIVGDENKVN